MTRGKEPGQESKEQDARVYTRDPTIGESRLSGIETL